MPVWISCLKQPKSLGISLGFMFVRAAQFFKKKMKVAADPLKMTGKPFFLALQALVTKTNSFTAGEAETAFAQSYWSQQLYLVHRANTHCKTQRKEKKQKTTVCQRNVLFVFKY